MNTNPLGNYLPNTNNVFWNLGTIGPGESKTLQVTGRAISEGQHCNIATVQTSRGLQEQAETCTNVTGQSALLLKLRDKPDPTKVGTQTTYSMIVTNRGTANARNIKITAMVPDGMEYVSSKGPTARLVVVGKLVDFDPVPKLKPKESLLFTVTLKGTEPGNHRFRVEMNANQLTNPIFEEESTEFYR